jgi:CBS domain-containing protein
MSNSNIYWKELNMTMYRRILGRVFLAVIPLLLSLAFAPFAGAEGKRLLRSRPRVYEQILRSTGLVLVQYQKTGLGGTCWVVDRQRRLVITNCHVTNDRKLGNPQAVIVFFPHYSGGKLVRNFNTYLKELPAIRAWVVATDVRRDLSLLQLESIPDDVQALPLARRAPRAGARVYSLGNSGMATKVGKITDKSNLWRFAQGKMVRVEFFRAPKKAWPVASKCIRLRSRIDHGDSGGPVVNKRGELVGVVSLSNLRTLAWCIHVAEVKRFLRGAPLGLLELDRGKKVTFKHKWWPGKAGGAEILPEAVRWLGKASCQRREMMNRGGVRAAGPGDWNPANWQNPLDTNVAAIGGSGDTTVFLLTTDSNFFIADHTGLNRVTYNTLTAIAKGKDAQGRDTVYSLFADGRVFTSNSAGFNYFGSGYSAFAVASSF